MNQYLGGGQTPLLRGLLRAAVVRARVSGYVDYEFNDTDSAGVVPGNEEGAEIVNRVERREWLPLVWEYPFSPKPFKRMLRIKHQERLVIAGVNLRKLSLKQLLVSEIERELDWAKSLFLSDGVRQWINQGKRDEIEDRVRACKLEARKLIDSSCTIGEFWLSIGQWMLGECLFGVKVVSFAHDYWRLTQASAGDRRFSVLGRFISEPDTIMPYFLEAKGIAPDDITRLPFFAVYERDGWYVRDELILTKGKIRFGDVVLGESVNCVGDLAAKLGEAQIIASIVPKILPLIVQLRQLGTIYLTDPPYLASARKFSDSLGIDQQDILSVRFDLRSVISKPLWRALVRGFHGRCPGPTRDDKSMHHFQHHPTLVFLWVLGGIDIIKKLVEASQLKRLKG